MSIMMKLIRKIIKTYFLALLKDLYDLRIWLEFKTLAFIQLVVILVLEDLRTFYIDRRSGSERIYLGIKYFKFQAHSFDLRKYIDNIQVGQFVVIIKRWTKVAQKLRFTEKINPFDTLTLWDTFFLNTEIIFWNQV